MADRTELLESALESLVEGVALADREGSLVLWNRSAEITHGIWKRGDCGAWGARDSGCAGGGRHATVGQADGYEELAGAWSAGAVAAQGWT
jgi:hypothetical protein